MILAIKGPRSFDDISVIHDALDYNAIDIADIDEIACGGDKDDFDKCVIEFADDENILVTKFPILWNALKVEGADIQTNKWGKKYNKNAAKDRDAKLLDHVDAVLIIFPDDKSKFLKRAADAKGVEVFEFHDEVDEEGKYQF